MSLRLFCLAAAFAASPAAGAAQSKDPAARAFQYCYSCHSIDPAEEGLQGPTLFGVIGRPIASVPAYKYSDALRAFAKKEKVWTVALLERFMQHAPAMAPGTLMEPPPGMDRPENRKLVIEYLARYGRR